MPRRSMPRVEVVIRYPFSLDGVRYAPTDQIVRCIGKEEFERILRYDDTLNVERCEGNFFDQLEMRYGTKFAMQFHGQNFMNEVSVARIKYRLDGIAQQREREKGTIHYHANLLCNAIEEYEKFYPYRTKEIAQLNDAMDIVKKLRTF